MAERFGISIDRAKNHNADKSIALKYAIISETMSYLRANQPIAEKWENSIEEGFQKCGEKILSQVDFDRLEVAMVMFR